MSGYHQASQIQFLADLILGLVRAGHRDGFQGHYRRGFLHVHRKGRGFVLIGHGDGLFSRGGRIEPAHLVILYSSLAAVAVMSGYHQSSQIQLVSDLILSLGRAAHRDGFQSDLGFLTVFFVQISINLLNFGQSQSAVINHNFGYVALIVPILRVASYRISSYVSNIVFYVCKYCGAIVSIHYLLVSNINSLTGAIFYDHRGAEAIANIFRTLIQHKPAVIRGVSAAKSRVNIALGRRYDKFAPASAVLMEIKQRDIVSAHRIGTVGFAGRYDHNCGFRCLIKIVKRKLHTV